MSRILFAIMTFWQLHNSSLSPNAFLSLSPKEFIWTRGQYLRMVSVNSCKLTELTQRPLTSRCLVSSVVLSVSMGHSLPYRSTHHERAHFHSRASSGLSRGFLMCTAYLIAHVSYSFVQKPNNKCFTSPDPRVGVGGKDIFLQFQKCFILFLGLGANDRYFFCLFGQEEETPLDLCLSHCRRSPERFLFF